MLELSGPRPSWRGAAYDGWLRVETGEQLRVLALLGPEGATPDALDRARRAAATAMTLRHPGVLRLIQVVPYEGRIAWCYEPSNGIGLVHLVGSDVAAELPARAAAELLAAVTETLLGLGPVGLQHPGPEPADLVLSANGAVAIASFSGPYPADPAMRAPDGGGGETGTVYRLGVLLAQLTSGSAPPPSADPSAHGVAVRRALIRAMARPGPVLSDRYGQWMRGMLAWAPAERPPLSSIPAGLRAVAWATGGEGLADWAARRVPDLVGTIEARAASFRSADTPPSGPRAVGVLQLTPPPQRSKDRGSGWVAPSPDDDTVPPEDDRTQEETLRPSGTYGSARDARAGLGGGMPVDVGPPPQVLSKLPTLPTGFLDQPEVAARREPLAPTPTELTRPLGGNPATWLGVIIGLLIVVLLLTLLLLFGEPMAPAPPAPPPSVLHRAVGPVEAPPPEARDPAVPAPDLVQATAASTEELLAGLPASDSDEPESTAPVAAGDGATVHRAGQGPYLVRFRLAPGLDGSLMVSCAGMAQAAVGRRELLVSGLSNDQSCRVRAQSPAGQQLDHQVQIRGPAPIDCFHDWREGCLD